MNLSRESALALLHEYTKSESLIKHALSVEASMLWYAKHFSQSEEEALKWGVTGLLHDFDYEKFPEPTSPDGHPFKGNTILGELGYPEEVREAIMGHAHYTGVARTTQMAKVLFAVDELSGLVTASVLVRPDKSLLALEAKSVLKKMKDKAFAASVCRDNIRQCAEAGLELDDFLSLAIEAMRTHSAELGLSK